MFKRIIAVIAATAYLVLATLASPASAASFMHDPSAVPAVVFTFDPGTVVQLILAVVLPILVGLVTTRVTRASVKSWLLAGLTLVTSLFVELARAISDGTTYDVGIALLAAIPAFAISVASHYGLWKPAGVSGAAQDFGVRTVQPPSDPLP